MAADCFTGSGVELVVFVLLYLLLAQSWQFPQALFNRENTYCSSKCAAAERLMRDDCSWFTFFCCFIKLITMLVCCLRATEK